MTTSKANNYWVAIIFILLAVIVTGSITISSRYSRGHTIEISLPPEQVIQGEIYVDGAVSNPGIYPITAADSLEDIIRSAGGATDNADLTRPKLHIPRTGDDEQSQKININEAEAWLLEALPGIGETRAQSIIDYRMQNGPFHNINELTKVEGIGTAIYEKIKSLVTVTD